MELDTIDPDGPESAALAVVPLPPGGRFGISWGPGNELLLAGLAAAHADPQPGAASSSADPATAASVQWSCPSPAERRIAYDTLPSFKQLQLALRSGGSEGSQEAVLAFSRAVSDVLATEDPGDEAAAELSRERALWELLELFFATGTSAQGTITEGLARWLARNQRVLSPQPLTAALDAIGDALPAETAPGFWAAAARAASLGWTKEAVEALCSHSAMLRWADESERPAVQAEVDVLEPVVLLLRRMPRYMRAADRRTGAGRDFDDYTDFQHYRAAWQGQCRDFLASAAEWRAAEAAAPDTAAGLRHVLRVLAGEEAALVEAATSWPELLVAQLLHSFPDIRPQVELRPLLRRCLGLRSPGNGAALPPPLDVLPEMLQAAAEGDVQTVVASAATAGCSPWFLAHAPLLLAASPRGAAVLRKPLPHAGGDQIEAYLLEYVAALAPHRSTAAVAAEYLAWCPVHGRAAFEQLLPRLPAAMALHLARQHAMPQAAAGIRRAEAAQHLRRGHLGAAVAELAAAGDASAIASAVAPLLARVATDLTASSQPALERLTDLGQLEWLLGVAAGAASEPASSSTTSVAFLRAYHRLTTAWAALGDPKAHPEQARAEASAAAVGALEAAPQRLWLPLAAAVTPLIESSPPILSLQDTQRLLLRLQEAVSTSFRLEADPPGLAALPPPDKLSAKQQAATVAQALARNFARAHVAEMQPVS